MSGGLGNAFPLRSLCPDLVIAAGKWTGGGAASNMTQAAGDVSHGIASVAYNGATGKYLVTFTGVGQQLVHAEAKVHRPTTGAAPLGSNILLASYDGVAKTVQVEFGAPLTDINTNEQVTFFFVWSKQKP